jgi:hypothetical protein
MFSLFSRKGSLPPLPQETCTWIDTKFLWLVQAFGEETIRSRKILTPHYSQFPFDFGGDMESAQGSLAIIADQMDIKVDDLELFLYPDGAPELSMAGGEDDHKYFIGLEQQRLSQPDSLIATLAYELARIKLLEIGGVEDIDERMTDMATVLFGLGIFNANSAVQAYSDTTYTGWSEWGHLRQMEWGYALALFAHWRQEEYVWIDHLPANLKSDFKKSYQWITTHPLFS